MGLSFGRKEAAMSTINFNYYYIYDEDSPSLIRHRVDRKLTKAGDIVKSAPNAKGYSRIYVAGKSHLIHRVIYTMFNGPIPDGYFIDHIDGDPRNNKPDNLRLASNSQNQYNSKSRTVRLNPDLPKGIHEDRPGYFRAYISKDGKSYRKGGKCLQTVINWLIDKRRALHGEFARA